MTQPGGQARADSIVEQVYEKLRAMAVTYALRPGERVNEGDLSRRFGVSRTPLREALNRLNTEGLLRFVPGKGFYCRDLDPKEIFDLYEARRVIEAAAARLAAERAEPAAIEALDAYLVETGAEAGERGRDELVRIDETFHERLTALSGNAELVRVLRNIDARIQFVRWLDLDRRLRPQSHREHRAIVLALRRRDGDACAALVEKHITRRRDQLTETIRRGVAEIYVDRAAREVTPLLEGTPPA